MLSSLIAAVCLLPEHGRSYELPGVLDHPTWTWWAWVCGGRCPEGRGHHSVSDEIRCRSRGWVGRSRPQEVTNNPITQQTTEPHRGQKSFPAVWALPAHTNLFSALSSGKQNPILRVCLRSEVISTARLQPTDSSFRIHNQYRLIHWRFPGSSAGLLSGDFLIFFFNHWLK